MSETTPSTDVEVDSVFAVLSNERRRRVLRHLFEPRSSATVTELVDRLVTAELNGHDRPEELTERITISLHHIHLPKLAESNLVDFDHESGEVTLNEAAAAIEPHLALVPE